MNLRESRDVIGSTGHVRPVSLSSSAVGELRSKAPRTRPHQEARMLVTIIAILVIIVLVVWIATHI